MHYTTNIPSAKSQQTHELDTRQPGRRRFMTSHRQTKIKVPFTRCSCLKSQKHF